VLPKYLNGKPSDKAALPAWMPIALKRRLAAYVTKREVCPMEGYGLPEPDHQPLKAHPTVSGEFLMRLGSGDIRVKPDIERFEGGQVRFSDGSVETVDVVVTPPATG